VTRERREDADQLLKTLADPLRVRILGALGTRVASPSDIAREIDADLTLVSYHFRVLRDAGLVKWVRDAPRRGARETYYKASSPPVLKRDVWGRASAVIKQVIVQSNLRTIGKRVNEAARAGGFERDNAQLLHTPLLLDEKGWKEASELVGELQPKLQKVGERAEKRSEGKDAEDLIDCSSVLMLFTAREP
jgi:DNA-binding transcriptional ArsR family regulator